MTERDSGRRDLNSICFGLIIKRLRVERGWTMLQLAAASGINRVHVGIIERGGNSPNLRTFVSLCYTLGADPAEVLREVLRNSAQMQQGA